MHPRARIQVYAVTPIDRPPLAVEPQGRVSTLFVLAGAVAEENSSRERDGGLTDPYGLRKGQEQQPHRGWYRWTKVRAVLADEHYESVAARREPLCLDDVTTGVLGVFSHAAGGGAAPRWSEACTCLSGKFFRPCSG